MVINLKILDFMKTTFNWYYLVNYKKKLYIM